MATKTEKQPALIVGYSDATAVITVTDPQTDAVADTLDVRALAPNAPEVVILGFVRYIAGAARDAVAAAEKAKKDAGEAIARLFKAVTEGTLQFRERGGEGGLSLEQEMAIIAAEFVRLEAAATLEEALAEIKARYDVVKQVTTPQKGTPATGKEGEAGYIPASDDYRPAKVSDTHPEYNALKKIPDIAAALATAGKVDSKAQLQGLLKKKAQ